MNAWLLEESQEDIPLMKRIWEEAGKCWKGECWGLEEKRGFQTEWK